MVTLQIPKSAGSKVDIGNKVLCGVDAIDTSPIANRVDAFQKVHAQYHNMQKGVLTAMRALDECREVIAEARSELDRNIESLAVALPHDGFDRKQPFRALDCKSPSALWKMNHPKAVEEVLTLEKAVMRHPLSTAKTIHVAEGAGNAARALHQALGQLDVLEKGYLEALAKREAYDSLWNSAFTSLKGAARIAEHDGHRGILAALFERPAPAKRKPRAKTAPAVPS